MKDISDRPTHGYLREDSRHFKSHFACKCCSKGADLRLLNTAFLAFNNGLILADDILTTDDNYMPLGQVVCTTI